MNFLSSFLIGWNFCGIDSIGKSRGIIMAWNESILVSNSKCSLAGILIEGVLEGLGIESFW